MLAWAGRQNYRLILVSLVLGLAARGIAQEATNVSAPTAVKPEDWSIHFQATTISQKHGSFNAPYAGANSMETTEPWRTTETATLFLGLRLWSGAEIYVNPEASGGKGLSGAVGAAGFPNGEATRVGESKFTPYLARLFLRQTINLGGESETVSADANQLAGKRTKSNLTFTLGKLAAGDVFDDNSLSHDPRTQFENWSLMANGAWDFPADTRGYTYGLTVELNEPGWALRAGSLAEPTEANGSDFDHHISHALGDVVEFEKSYTVGSRAGVVRLLSFINYAHMGSYQETINTSSFAMDITRSRKYRSKFGCGVNVEQEIADDVGLFGRAGWNDGQTETWAFTEIDNTLSLGLSVKGTRWHRKNDVFGLAGVSNGLSPDHRDYLSAGGYGFIVGDSRLSYGRENILETYYAANLIPGMAISFDCQLIGNPAYNRDRGPIFVGGFRVHVAY